MAAWQVQVREKENPANAIVAWLGEGPPTPSGGGGGWETIALPRTHSVQVWRGDAPIVQSIPIVLGATSVGAPIAPALRTLTAMWMPEDDGPPPVVQISAEGDTVLFQNRDYVITNLELGDAVANTGQQRVQQAITLELTEYKPDVRLIPASQRPTTARPGRARTPQTYRVKRGDTLSSIAKKFKLSSWRPLAALNKISDPRELRVGTVLRVPRP